MRAGIRTHNTCPLGAQVVTPTEVSVTWRNVDVSSEPIGHSVRTTLESPVTSRQTKRMPGNVLVVDDSAVSRQLLKRVLRRRGHVVFTAADGTEAVTLLEQHAIDVVVTDLQMTALDGHGLIQHVRGRPSLDDLAVIIFTGDDSPDALARARQSGATDVIVKGTDMRRLVDQVDRIATEARVSCPPPARDPGPPSTAPSSLQIALESGRCFAPLLFTELAQHRIGLKEQAILDVGTGIGTLARALAERGANVTAVDAHEHRFEAARALDRAAAVHVDYHLGRAEELPFAVDAFETVVTRDCFGRFDQKRACREFVRVLRPGGSLAVVRHSGIARTRDVVALTSQYLEAHGARYLGSVDNGISPAWLDVVLDSGFGDLRTFSFDHQATFSIDGWVTYALRHSDLGGQTKQSLFDGLLEHCSSHLTQPTCTVHRRTWTLVAKSPT